MATAEQRALALLRRWVKPSYLRVRQALSSTLLEDRHGIETARGVQLEDLDLAAPGRVTYVASGWLDLRRILPRSEVGPQDVFIDFGSGKGRIVYQAAANYPFKRVLGVELSEELNAVARANIDRNRNRLLCSDVELITADVRDYDIPDDVTLAYFYNPFQGPIFAAVIDGLLGSLDRRPRRLRVIYRTPIEHDALMATGRFRVTATLRGMRPGREWSRANSLTMYEALH